METIAVIFAMIFVGIIVICIVVTMGEYIANASSPNNKLEDNIKKFGKQKR